MRVGGVIGTLEFGILFGEITNARFRLFCEYSSKQECVDLGSQAGEDRLAEAGLDLRSFFGCVFTEAAAVDKDEFGDRNRMRQRVEHGNLSAERIAHENWALDFELAKEFMQGLDKEFGGVFALRLT